MVEMTFWNENWKLGWARWTRGKRENVNNQLLGMVDFGGGYGQKCTLARIGNGNGKMRGDNNSGIGWTKWEINALFGWGGELVSGNDGNVN